MIIHRESILTAAPSDFAVETEQCEIEPKIFCADYLVKHFGTPLRIDCHDFRYLRQYAECLPRNTLRAFPLWKIETYNTGREDGS